jgi:Na+/H+ antiporter NhaD/arsenite permease-like protein
MKETSQGAVPIMAAGVLVAVGICAMFRGTDRAAPGVEPGAALWLGADFAPEPATGPGGATGRAITGAMGVRVRRVWSHSPALRAGLAAGDVILQMNGAPVSSPGNVEAALVTPGASKKMTLDVLRDGKPLSLPVTLQTKPRFALNVGVALVVMGVAFALLYLTSLDRVAVMGCGAIVAVILGTQLGFYDQDAALQSIRLSTLALLLGMGLITAALEDAGFFTVVARKIGKLSRGDWSRLMVLLCVTTFFLSAHVNNLTTILMVLPITLGLARELRFDPTPFVIAEIISSNLGGASSMIGDFPNMLIASETGRHYHEFLLYMMPPCLVQLVITIWYMSRMRRSHARQAQALRPTALPSLAASSEVTMLESHRPMRAPAETAGGEPTRTSDAPAPAPKKMRQALLVLSIVTVAFFFCGHSGVPPATVALAGGFTILLLWRRAAPNLISRGGFGDILFFASLFVLVGCAEASGLLDFIADWMLEVSGGGTLGLALVLMWVAAIITAFLNAGPTTALFVPVVAGLGISDPHGLIWWALSLGVCAGSCATITGATAGPVALTKVAEFVRDAKEKAAATPVVDLSFFSYARIGVPLMLVFLVISSTYIWGLTVWS